MLKLGLFLYLNIFIQLIFKQNYVHLKCVAIKLTQSAE